MSIFETIGSFNKARLAIYKHVGFEEDWTVHPLDFKTEYAWFIHDNKLTFFDPEKPAGGMNHFESPLFEDRFYPKNVYVGEEITLVFENTQTDGNRFWAILDNQNRIDPVISEDHDDVAHATFEKWNQEHPIVG